MDLDTRNHTARRAVMTFWRGVTMLGLLLAPVIGLRAQAPAPQTLTPQQQAISAWLSEAEAARQAADFAVMQAKADEAVRLSRQSADDAWLSRSLNVVAQSYFFRARPGDCLSAAEEATAIAARVGDPAVELVTINTLAGCLRSAGRFEDAITWFTRAVDLSRTTKNTSREATLLGNIAMVYQRLGEPEFAVDWAGRAVARARASGDIPATVFTLQTLGNARGLGGDTKGAVEAHHEALTFIGRLPASGFVTLARLEESVNIGIFEYLSGRHDDARRTLSGTLEDVRATPYPMVEALAASYLGWTELTTARLDEAEQALVRARTAWAQANSAEMATEMLMTEIGYARVLRGRGRAAEALAVDQAILQSLERFRIGRNVTSVSAATSLLAASRAYVDTIDLLIDAGRTAEAYDVSERYRARTFLDAMDEQRSGVGRAMTEAQRSREAALADEATRAQMRLWNTTAPAAEQATLRRRLIAIDDELMTLRREVRRQDPRYGAVHFPVILSAADVQRTLDPSTAIVSFVSGETRSFVFAVTASGITAAALPAQAELEPRIVAYRQLISTRPAPGVSRLTRIRSAAAALTRTLLSPVAPAIAGKTHLLVITDGALNALPFEALGALPPAVPAPRGPTWLGEHVAISYAPSASALAAIGSGDRTEGATRVLAVGDPAFTPSTAASRQSVGVFTALPFTRIEVQQIGRLFAGTTTLVGAAATPDAVTRMPLDTFRYIHVATHAFVNAVRPGRSGIALSAGPARNATGILLADDVTKLTLRADLVTLSACETGLGRSIAGEGVMGLARSFLIAGSKSVAASLWNVNDEATAALMVRFYSGLKAGKPRDEALSAARRALMQGADTRLKDPYYWAPFILIGATR